MEISNKKLQDKLSMLNAKKMISKVTGIHLLSISTKKPDGMEWIFSFKRNDIYKEEPRFKFPYGICKENLAEHLDFIFSSKKEFLIIYYDYIPIYISFQIINLVEFLRSYAIEQKSLDMTLFSLSQQEIIDISTEENDIEVRLIPVINH